MKLWKNLMVVAVALLLISAIMAAQYIAVETDAVLSVDTQHAGLQIAASDPSLSAEDHQWLLEYSEENSFQLDLGTWGEQNKFVSSQAFLIANAGEAPFKISGVTVTTTDSPDTQLLGNNINIWLLYEETGDPATDGTGVQVWDAETHTDGTANTGDLYFLNDVVTGDSGIAEPYDGGNLQIWHTGTETGEDVESGAAAWLDSGTGDELWVYSEDDATTWNAALFDDGTISTPNSNAVWVYIEVVPTEEMAGGSVTGTLSFDIEYTE